MSLTLEEVTYRILPRVAPGRALADTEWATLRNVAEVLIEGAPPGVTPARAADNVEAFLARGRSPVAWRVRVLLTAIEYAPFPSQRCRFSSLPLQARRSFVAERFVGGSGIWGLCAKVRLLVLMGVYGDAEAMAPIGFVPVPLRSRFQGQSATEPLEVEAAS